MTQAVKRVSPTEIYYAEDDGLYYYNNELFTGITFTTHPNGEPRSEVEFQYGHRWGFARGWYSNGQLLEEIQFRQGAVHGFQREWEKDGTLVYEEECEYGITLIRREFQNDNLVETYHLTKDEKNYTLLEELRSFYRLDGD